MQLQKLRGALALFGPEIDTIAEDALASLRSSNKFGFPLNTSPYHITLAHKGECATLHDASIPTPDTRKIHVAGVGTTSGGEIVFVVVIWAAGQQLRKSLGLPPKDFHITLSEKDIHNVSKGIDTLIPGQFPSSPSVDFLDHLVFTLHLFKQYWIEQPYCAQLVSYLPESHRGFLRLGDAALGAELYKLAMLSYACAYERATDEKVHSYCLKKLEETSQGTDWGTVMLDFEKDTIPDEISSLLLTPWSSTLRTVISERELVPTLCIESRERPSTPGSRLPRFFRWMVPFHIALMSTPRDESDINTLSSPHLAIRHILTLTEEDPLPKAWFRGKSISNTFLPIPNYQPPSIEQMDIIMRLLQDESKLPILVHCGGGKGRAGTVAACYLAAYGFSPTMNPYQEHPALSASEAVAALRLIRPGSIETDQQEAFVGKWCSELWKRRCIIPDLIPEAPPCPLEIQGVLSPKDDLFVLVGLPGSGKSFLSNSLLSRDPRNWTRISQDEAGSRSSCESQIGRAPNTPRVFLDRCNTSAEDRKSWLALASNWVDSPVCVWFDYDRELCTHRAQSRPDHPTLRPGNRVRNAVEQMQSSFVRPSLDEGFKAIVTIRSFAAAEDFVRRLSPPVGIFKYPRTSHLLDLGATTVDDIVSGRETASFVVGEGTNVLITEKVDGANLGFSLDSDRSILVQNRSHYVNSASHEQFKKLGAWIEEHREELHGILDRDAFFPQRYTLFGEWLYATHSIPYSKLPDRFMAFDLYDRATGLWADRGTLTRVLSGTKIHIVPLVYEGTMPSDDKLKDMVQQPSKFWDGKVEGVFVKVEKNGIVVNRSKVVRGDFIAGNDHWTKGIISVNSLAKP